MEEKDEQDLAAPVAAHRTRSSAAAQSITRTISYGGQDGYSAFQETTRTRTAGSSRWPGAQEDDVVLEEEEEDEDDDDPFTVGWDGGDADPANPRRASPARKWGVVLIMATSSLCV